MISSSHLSQRTAVAAANCPWKKQRKLNQSSPTVAILCREAGKCKGRNWNLKITLGGRSENTSSWKTLRLLIVFWARSPMWCCCLEVLELEHREHDAVAAGAGVSTFRLSLRADTRCWPHWPTLHWGCYILPDLSKYLEVFPKCIGRGCGKSWKNALMAQVVDAQMHKLQPQIVNLPILQVCANEIHSHVSNLRRKKPTLLRDVCKKTGKMYEFWKKHSTQISLLLYFDQVVFGMPKSFSGAKTCFTIGGKCYLINLITLS